MEGGNQPEPNQHQGRIDDHQRDRIRTPLDVGHDWGEYDDTVMRSVKVEAPPFDGKLDPKVFLNWLSEMDAYFGWYDLSEARRVQFAKMKLIGQDFTKGQ